MKWIFAQIQKWTHALTHASDQGDEMLAESNALRRKAMEWRGWKILARRAIAGQDDARLAKCLNEMGRLEQEWNQMADAYQKKWLGNH